MTCVSLGLKKRCLRIKWREKSLISESYFTYTHIHTQWTWTWYKHTERLKRRKRAMNGFFGRAQKRWQSSCCVYIHANQVSKNGVAHWAKSRWKHIKIALARWNEMPHVKPLRVELDLNGAQVDCCTLNVRKISKIFHMCTCE